MTYTDFDEQLRQQQGRMKLVLWYGLMIRPDGSEYWVQVKAVNAGHATYECEQLCLNCHVSHVTTDRRATVRI